MAAVAVLAVLALTTQAESASCQTNKEIRGLPNFGRVTDTLFRGAQPDSAGFSTLREMGVGLVVNFRDEKSKIATEKRQVEALGIKYVGIPWSGHDEVSSAQVVEFLDLVRANPNIKIFVHCKRGADRTGVMVAAYRIAVEHQTVSQAVSEMYRFHYAGFWLPHLRRYVESIPSLLQTDARFSAYNSALRPSVPAGQTVAPMAVIPPNAVSNTAPKTER
jgi:tyrosine-protein phosphatase SIW14